MLECVDCNKRIAFWEDGSEWEGAKHECEKCGGKTTSKHTKENNVLTTTETCEKCKHVKTDSLDLTVTKKEPEPIDPNLKVDIKRL
jgi:DNA replicative helicase MCM subunit Mcm2 (Cdc46/Mcm family)